MNDIKKEGVVGGVTGGMAGGVAGGMVGGVAGGMVGGISGVPVGGVMGDMTGGMMHHHDPRRLYEMAVRHEKTKAAIYRELARTAPTMCLRQKFMYLASKEAYHLHVLSQVAGAYGLPGHHVYPGHPVHPGPPVPSAGPAHGPTVGVPGLPGFPPVFYTQEEKK